MDAQTHTRATEQRTKCLHIAHIGQSFCCSDDVAVTIFNAMSILIGIRFLNMVCCPPSFNMAFQIVDWNKRHTHRIVDVMCDLKNDFESFVWHQNVGENERSKEKTNKTNAPLDFSAFARTLGCQDQRRLSSILGENFRCSFFSLTLLTIWLRAMAIYTSHPSRARSRRPQFNLKEKANQVYSHSLSMDVARLCASFNIRYLAPVDERHFSRP